MFNIDVLFQFRCSELTEENCRLQEMIIELRRELSDYEEDESEKNTGLKQTLAEAKRNEEAFKELKVFVEKMVEETTQVIL